MPLQEGRATSAKVPECYQMAPEKEGGTAGSFGHGTQDRPKTKGECAGLGTGRRPLVSGGGCPTKGPKNGVGSSGRRAEQRTKMASNVTKGGLVGQPAQEKQA